MSAPVIGMVLALITAIFWGALPVAMKQVLEVMSPITIVWYRFVVAFIGLGIWLTWRKTLPSRSKIKQRTLVYFLLATLGLTCNFVLFNTSLDYISPAMVPVILQLAPVILLITSAKLFNEKLGWHQIVGVISLFIGLMLFFNERLVELISSLNNYTIGVMMAVGAALVWVIYALMQKFLLKDFSSAQILFVVYGCCGLLLTPFAKINELMLLDQRQFVMLAFCCLNTLVAYGAFAEALVHWQAAKVSAVIALAPLFTILFVDLGTLIWPLYVEPVELNQLAYFGAFVVVAGAMICAAGHKLIKRGVKANEICR